MKIIIRFFFNSFLFKVFLFLLSSFFFFQNTSYALKLPVQVVVTLPVLADFVTVVGGKNVIVTSLISGLENVHTYTPKVSDIRTIQHADILYRIGLGLESWVDPLIKNTSRPDLQIITTSEGIDIIHDSSDLSDHHMEGNPHIWLDPENAKIMVRHIEKGLISVDSSNEDYYLVNTQKYIEKLESIEIDLQKKTAHLQNKKVITHHPAWPYFAKRFGFVIRDTILTQTEGEPSAKKIKALIDLIKDEGIKVIISEPQLNQKVVNILADETGIAVVPLSPLTGTIPGTEQYIDLIQYNTKSLISAFKVHD
ncbi:MAG: metal ABC transporter substrate-binding protein [Nitrospiria bacterium]